MLRSLLMASRTSPGMLAEIQLSVGRRPIRVLIALDSPMDCQLLLSASKRSRQQLSIVAWVVSRTDILHCFSRGNIDVALINADLEDGRMAGLDVLTEIHASYPGTPIVMLFDAWHDDLILHAFRAGAKGVFCRTEKKLDLLWKCIAAVHQGQVWASSRQLHLLLNTLTKAKSIREHTVSNYLFRIYNKLGISTRVELVLHIMKQREEHVTAS